MTTRAMLLASQSDWEARMRLGGRVTVVAILAGAVLVLLAAPSSADKYPPGPAPAGQQTIVVFQQVSVVPAAAPAAVQRAEVARTGGEIIRWTVIAAGLVALGSVLFIGERRIARARSE